MARSPTRDSHSATSSGATSSGATARRKAPAAAPAVVVQPAVPVDQWPDKTLLRISEVAQLVGVQAHVIRFWTAQFSAVRPERSSTGRLLFGRPAAERLLRIRAMLYDQGLTIAGARKALAAVAEKPKPAPAALPSPLLTAQIERLQTELRGVQAREAAARAGEAHALLQLAAARQIAAALPKFDAAGLLGVAAALDALATRLEAPLDL